MFSTCPAFVRGRRFLNTKKGDTARSIRNSVNLRCYSQRRPSRAQKIHHILLLGMSLCCLFGCAEDPAIKRGKQLAATGNTAAAIQQFESTLSENPSNAEAHYQLGLVYALRADKSEAIRALKQAQELAPRRAEITFALGSVYWANNNRALALEQFRQLTEDSPPREMLLKVAGITGDAYRVQRLRTEGSGDYEQTFTEKGTMMSFTAKHSDDYSPAISPDGKWIAFASYRLQNGEIYLMNLDTRELRQLTHTEEHDEYMPMFSPDGKMLAFVAERTRGGMMLPAVQASGSAAPRGAAIYLMKIDGRNQRPLIKMQGAQSAPAFSPDGTKIAFESNEGSEVMQIYVVNTDGTGKKQLTHNTIDDGHPAWSPDGKHIAFTSEDWQIYRMSVKGGEIKQLTDSKASHYQPIFSPDGKRIIYVSDAGYHYTLWMMDADGTNKTQLTNHIGAHFEPSISRDGKKLVFSSDRSDHMRIYLMDLTRPVQQEELKARLADFGE